MSDSDSDVGPSKHRGAAQLANMASQFLGTASTHQPAAESIFIGQQADSGISESSDYGLGALDPFALDDHEPSAGPSRPSPGRGAGSSGWKRNEPAVINTEEESDYGFHSEVIDEQQQLRTHDEPRRTAATVTKESASAAQPKQYELIKPQDTSWLAVYFVCLLVTLGIWIWSYVFANAPYRFSTSLPDDQGDTEAQEAQSIFSILPTLTTFTLVSIASSMGVMFLLSQAVRRMVWGLLVAGPIMLVSTAFWGWGMSFSSIQNQGSETRWACFVALLLAGITGRMIYTRIQRIDKTIQVIEVRDLFCQIGLSPVSPDADSSDISSSQPLLYWHILHYLAFKLCFSSHT